MKKAILISALVPYVISPSFAANVGPNEDLSFPPKRRLSASSDEGPSTLVPSPHTLADQRIQELLHKKQVAERKRNETLLHMLRTKQALAKAQRDLTPSPEDREES